MSPVQQQDPPRRSCYDISRGPICWWSFFPGPASCRHPSQLTVTVDFRGRTILYHFENKGVKGIDLWLAWVYYISRLDLGRDKMEYKAHAIAKATRESIEVSHYMFLTKLEDRVHNASSWKFSFHLRESMYKRYIDLSMVEETLRTCKILDIQLMSDGDIRLLIRNPHNGICVVVNPYTFHAITTYRNNVDDNHTSMKDSEKRLYMEFRDFAKKFNTMIKDRR